MYNIAHILMRDWLTTDCSQSRVSSNLLFTTDPEPGSIFLLESHLFEQFQSFGTDNRSEHENFTENKMLRKWSTIQWKFVQYVTKICNNYNKLVEVLPTCTALPYICLSIYPTVAFSSRTSSRQCTAIFGTSSPLLTCLVGELCGQQVPAS